MARLKFILAVMTLILVGVMGQYADALRQVWWNVVAPSHDVPKVAFNTLQRTVSDLSFKAFPQFDSQDKERAVWGKKIFFDTSFSANNEIACSTCHAPAKSFTDGNMVARGLEATTKNSPTIINSFANTWFFWDGRADSLANQALGPIENPLEHGMSRGRVVQLIWQNHRGEYEKLYGSFPLTLDAFFKGQDQKKFHAMPAAPYLELAVEQAAYIVATIAQFNIQRRFITQAFTEDEAPQKRLARLVMQSEGENPEWIAQHNGLSPDLQKEIDQVFARFGEAIAAYESGIVAIESPFDAFAARLQNSSHEEEAFGEGFGAEEFRGLSIFLDRGCTNCHNGPNFTDQQFHNIGLPQRGDALELGRARGVLFAEKSPFNCHGGILPNTDKESCLELSYINTKNFEYVGAQKTPTLRNITETAPYMHDGRFKNLDEVMRHYNLLSAEPAVGHREESLQPLHLSEKDLDALKAFLHSLTSPIRDLNE